MFSRMLSALGVGGPSADTVLDAPRTAPGQVVTGQVHVQGGRGEAEVGRIVLSLVTSVEAEYGDRELYRVVVRESVRVLPGQVVSIPFRLQVPWETPVTAVGGVRLPGVSVGVRTSLVVVGAPVRDRLDVVRVEPAPGQARLLDAFSQLGFRLRRAGVGTGRLPGVRYEPDLYQELAFLPPVECAGEVGEVELTFVAGPHELCVILDAARRGDAPFGLFHVTNEAVLSVDWPTLIGEWLTQVTMRTDGKSGFLRRVDLIGEKG
jgi:sporulation-control protein